MSQKNTQATEGQQKQIVRIIHDALPDRRWIEEFLLRLNLDKEGAQMLIESGNALHEVRKFLAHKVKELSDPNTYADQVVESTHGYRSGYRKARPIDEQIRILRQYHWRRGGREIDWTLNEVQQQLLARPAPRQTGSEGYFAVVFDQTMVIDGEEYLSDQSDPIILALNALSKECRKDCINHCELGPRYYRRSKKSAEKMKQLWESQGCPTGIILIPAQLGIKHCGKSVLRARVVIRGAEFPLDAYETIQMVLTHRYDRLNHHDDLFLDLPGAEYSPDAVDVFNDALHLWINCDRVELGYRNAGYAHNHYGSVSGFLPQ